MVFKIHPEALIPLRSSYIDIFPFLVFFFLSFLALVILLRRKKINIWRKFSQVISLFLFIYFTAECFCFIRNALLFGIPLIGKEELLSFGYLILFVFVVAFALVFGRIFCGWICPFGFLQEIFFFFNKKIPKKLYLPLLGLAITGGIVYIILLKPSQDIILQFIPNFLAILLLLILFLLTINIKLEPKLKRIKFFIFFFWVVLLLSRVYTFQPWCYLYGLMTGEYGIVGAFLLVIASSVLFYRPYCRFICPVGVLLYFCSNYSLFNLKKSDCKKCGKCKQICLLQNINEGRVKDKGDCILCGRCVEKNGFRFVLR